MPKIETETIATHRQWRREKLIQAAIEIALENKGFAITVADVAKRAGISRTTVYEYFASSDDLVADLVSSELASFARELEAALGACATLSESVTTWIEISLLYVADGRHMIMKSLNLINSPALRAQAIKVGHQQLFSMLHRQLEIFGVQDAKQCLASVQAVIEVATRAIERGSDAALEIKKTSAFCIAGIKALI